ncbi:MAG TPA: LON peptidase substrate-binding domain-containing protein, partial [Myxococcota bacterium]
MSDSTAVQTLPLLPLRDGVLLPGTVATIPVGRPASVALINAVNVGGVVAVGVQRDASVADPAFDDLHEIAVVARISKIQRMPRGYQVTLEGLSRVRLDAITTREPYLQASVTAILDLAKDAPRASELADALRAELTDVKATATGPFARALDSLLE